MKKNEKQAIQKEFFCQNTRFKFRKLWCIPSGCCCPWASFFTERASRWDAMVQPHLTNPVGIFVR